MSTAAQLLKLYSDGVIDAEALSVGLKSLPSAAVAQPAQGSVRARKRARQKKKRSKVAKTRIKPEDLAGARLRLKPTPTKKATASIKQADLRRAKEALRRAPQRPTADQLREEIQRREHIVNNNQEPAPFGPDDVYEESRYFVRADRYVNDPKSPTRYRLV